MPGGAVVGGDVGHHQPGADASTARSRVGAVGHAAYVGQHRVRSRRSGACSSSAARWSAGSKPGVSPAWGARLSTTTHPAAGLDDGPAQLGDEQVRDDRGEPRPGPEHHPVGLADRVDGLGARHRVGRLEGDGLDRAAAGGHLDLAAHGRHRVRGAPGRRPRTWAVITSGVSAIGSTRPGGAEQPAHPVESRDVVAELLPQARRSAGCRPRGRASRRRRRSGAGAPRPRSGPTRRRRTARPAPSGGRRAAGRRTPARSRPDEPPSSATVTTAVSRSTTWRSADSEACRPWPPPSATTTCGWARGDLTPARGRGGWWPRRSRRRPAAGEISCGHRHAAVLAAGAADRDGHEPLALGEVAHRPRPRGRAGSAARNCTAPGWLLT